MKQNREPQFLESAIKKLDPRPIIAMLALINTGIYAIDNKAGLTVIPVSVALSATVLIFDRLIKSNIDSDNVNK
jgi:hypothetical protein